MRALAKLEGEARRRGGERRSRTQVGRVPVSLLLSRRKKTRVLLAASGSGAMGPVRPMERSCRVARPVMAASVVGMRWGRGRDGRDGRVRVMSAGDGAVRWQARRTGGSCRGNHRRM